MSNEAGRIDRKPKSRNGSVEVEAEMATSMPMSRRNEKIKNEENEGSQKKIESPHDTEATEVASTVCLLLSRGLGILGIFQMDFNHCFAVQLSS